MDVLIIGIRLSIYLCIYLSSSYILWLWIHQYFLFHVLFMFFHNPFLFSFICCTSSFWSHVNNVMAVLCCAVVVGYPSLQKSLLGVSDHLAASALGLNVPVPILWSLNREWRRSILIDEVELPTKKELLVVCMGSSLMETRKEKEKEKETLCAFYLQSRLFVYFKA